MSRAACRLVWLIVLACAAMAQAADNPRGQNELAELKHDLRARGNAVEMESRPRGARLVLLHDSGDGHRFLITYGDGRMELVDAERYAQMIYRDQTDRAWLYRILNITSPIGIAWVVLGLGGQVLFTGRMLVQWLASEREKRSVVPVAFWWMSLLGATMLMVYFIWRKDVVGVLGQATGWSIYLRNLWLIYAAKRRAKTVPAPTQTDEPEPGSSPA